MEDITNAEYICQQLADARNLAWQAQCVLRALKDTTIPVPTIEKERNELEHYAHILKTGCTTLIYELKNSEI